MATNTFDNAGNGSNTYEDATDWDLGHIPIATEDVVISVDCTVASDQSAVACASLTVNSGITLTVANGADIRFTAASTITGTLTMAATSAVYFTDCHLTITATTGAAICDGGILNFVTTGSTVYSLIVNGSLTGTTNANGDTDITATCTVQDKFSIKHNNDAATISGLSAAKRLGVKMNAGANPGSYVDFVTHNRSCSYLHIDGARLGVYFPARGQMATGCDIENAISFGIYGLGLGATLRDCYIHGCGTGIYNPGSLLMTGGALGQTPAGASDANTTDLNIVGEDADFFNVIWETEVITAYVSTVRSTMHDGDAEQFMVLRAAQANPSIKHIIRSEFTTVQGGSRQSHKIVTDAGTTSDERLRFEFLLAAWPATHGDTLDVTLYVRGQSGDKIQVHVDPESHYGTTQTTEHTQSVNDTWELVTVAQYTVNTNADEKMGIPIVIRCEEASKTWYIDTLSVTQA